MKIPYLSTFILGLAALCPLVAFAQPTADTKKNPPKSEGRKAYIRRFNVAFRVSVLPLKPISEDTFRERLTQGPTEVITTSDSLAKRVGAGLSFEVALTDQYTVNADLLYRKFRFKNTSQIYTGTDNPNTSSDERTLRTVIDDTETGIWELPLLVRRYSRSRFESGPLWFFEGGGSLQRARGPRTTREDDGTFTDVTPSVSTKVHPGVVGGFGVHLTDDFGIKIIPEVRYTYWFSRTIDSRPARSNVHQVEVLVGISF